MKSINPYTLNELKVYKPLAYDEITEILPKIQHSYLEWKNTSFQHRSKLMDNLAALLKANSKKYGKLASEEMGKPIKEAVAEVEKCAWVCEYYAEHAEQFLADEQLETDYDSTIISFEPLGAILAIMPWNYPFWQVFRFAAPTIMAGNVAVLKHASNVPQCAKAIEKLFLEAGFPKYVFTTLLMNTDDVEKLIREQEIKAVSLTGSGKAGAIVASQAAKQIKKSLLELGGNDAFIVCKDANLAKAVEHAVLGRFQNNGQSCIAAKRFFIHEAIYDEFMQKFKELVQAKRLGNPLDESTTIGPLAKKEFVNTLDQQVVHSVEKGATIVCGGKISGEEGQFYEPTILENVQPGMPAFDEELFGPVASCIKFSTTEEVIELANNSDFGLGGSVWTNDIENGKDIARKIVTGTVAINDITKSDPRIPFGGVKDSGFGRELSKQGILEFVNQKAINVKKL